MAEGISNLSTADSAKIETAKKRILKDIQEVKNDHHFVNVSGSEHNLFFWEATLVGPAGTPYEGGYFQLLILFSNDYPTRPPKLRFVTKIYHCNVSPKGHISTLEEGDVLAANNTNNNNMIRSLLLSIHNLLSQPDPCKSHQPKIGREYVTNRERHDHVAKKWTNEYAHPALDDTSSSSSSSSYLDLVVWNTTENCKNAAATTTTPSMNLTAKLKGRVESTPGIKEKEETNSQTQNDPLSFGKKELSFAGGKAKKRNNSGRTSKKKNTKVTFSKTKRIKKVPHINNLPDEIIKACWYLPEEFKEIRQSCAAVVSLMNHGASSSSGKAEAEAGMFFIMESETTTRGLEYKTKNGAWERYENRQMACEAVFTQQEKQCDSTKENDPIKISELYTEVCKKCQKKAFELGKQDDEEVKEYLSDTRALELERLTATPMSSQQQQQPKQQIRLLHSSKLADPTRPTLLQAAVEPGQVHAT